jgi:hypothetical protein
MVRLLIVIDLLLWIAAPTVIALRARLGLPDELIGGLSGALFGAAAVFGGILADRWLRQREGDKERRESTVKIQSLVTAELIGVSTGLIDAERYLAAADSTVRAGGSLPSNDDLNHILPRPMSFTDSLGTDLLLLNSEQIDVLATLRANLAQTAMLMNEITAGRRAFGFLSADQLLGSVRHSMLIVAKCFDELDPNRMIQLPGRGPELVSELLRRVAEPRSAP